MSDTDQQPRLGLSISRNALLLALFAFACTAVIAGTYLLTADDIAQQQRQARLKALYEIIPRDSHDNDLLTDSRLFTIEALGHRDEEMVFIAKRGHRSSAVIYPVIARDGYSGDIELLVGINVTDNTVAGVRVLQHRETPGLGDKIDVRKSGWIDEFRGRSLGDPEAKKWTVKKDGGVFDGFTGATITPRAVTHAVRNALEFHRDQFASLQKKLP